MTILLYLVLSLWTEYTRHASLTSLIWQHYYYFWLALYSTLCRSVAVRTVHGRREATYTPGLHPLGAVDTLLAAAQRAVNTANLRCLA